MNRKNATIFITFNKSKNNLKNSILWCLTMSKKCISIILWEMKLNEENGSQDD